MSGLKRGIGKERARQAEVNSVHRVSGGKVESAMCKELEIVQYGWSREYR